MEELKKKVALQGDLVRTMKAENKPKKQVDEEVSKLLALKKQLEEAQAEKNKKDDLAKHRAGLENILTRRFFVVPAFEIYGGVAGLYDLGPYGCSLRQNIQDLWRRHFVLEENMLEVSCVNVTPEPVLKASGHVDKFTDFMVRDEKTGACHRADHVLEGHIDKLLDNPKAKKPIDAAKRKELSALRDKAGALDQKSLHAALQELGVKAPDTGNDISEPFPFNLMFVTQIGPTGKQTGYLRPETAQGIFVNFRRLLEANGGRMPFAAAQIGLAFRNEIAPRSGLLRVREFPLAEIEHFVNPNDKQHERFKEVQDVKLTLFSRKLQEAQEDPVSMTIAEAVAKGIVNNQTLGYFMARTSLFLLQVGIKKDKLRFRQHKANEMAHYASDCWDAEIHTTYGWIECVGIADRSAYDLKVHSEKSKVDLQAYESYPEPRLEKVVVVKLNKAKIGQTFRTASKALLDYLQDLKDDDALKLGEQLKKGSTTIKVGDGQELTLTSDMMKVTVEEQKVNGRNYIPAVIEPSFGIGRIMYAVMEHAFSPRGDAKELGHDGVLTFAPAVAPVKVSILPLSGNDRFIPFCKDLSRQFTAFNLANQMNDSGVSIGRRYARADEIGVPYAVTVDFQTIEDKTVTIRDRDSMQQIRVSLRDAVLIVAQLITETMTWPEAYNKYPKYFRPADEEE